jgi:hypothetical protein
MATESVKKRGHGNYVLWFLLVLAAGKILACSLTLGIGWITNASVLRRVADEIGESRADRQVRHAPTVDQSARPGATPAPEPPALPGYQVLEVYLSADSPAVGRRPLSDRRQVAARQRPGLGAAGSQSY